MYFFAALFLLAAAAENVPPLPNDIPKNAVMYSVLMASKPAGQMAVWDDAEKKHHAFFQFNDRGRGPKIYSTYEIGPDDIPMLTQISGNDYLKKPVEENFSITGNKASWKSSAEQGNTVIQHHAFYLGLNAAPEETAQLARALLKNGNNLSLLPAGEARIQRMDDLKIGSNGHSQTITEYAISGLDFSPTYIWMDSNAKLFAAGSAWTMVIREGWESAIEQILTAQSDSENKYAADLAKRLTHIPTKSILIYNVSLFDSVTATVKPAQTVLISGNKIQSVAPSQPADQQRKDLQIIDGSGKMLFPGFWDMHVHIGGTDGILHLLAGVTTVRDLANDIDDLTARRKRFDESTEIGPHVIPAGIIDGPGPYQGPTKVLVSTPEEARAAVDKYHQLGYPQIKIYSSVKPELVPLIIEEAHKNGQRVSGHIPAGMIAEECVRDGYNEIQHINFIVLNFFPEVKETRTPARMTVPGERGVEIDPNSDRVQSFFRLLLDKHVDVDPTLGAFENILTAQAGEIPDGWKTAADHLPPQVRRGLLAGGIAPPDKLQRYRDSFGAMLKLTKAMYDQKIPLDAGTDSVAGFSYQRELELLEKSGIPANKVLQIATLNSAKIMSKDSETGSITPGKTADLVLVNGDPTKNISDVRQVELVIKSGSIFYARELEEAVGVHR
ncbi:MAG: hypothetical protein C5B54_04525 [Acidobacteria bacterium]|nr:MAG: hypothetical protein C5B54_04525 [Acidobacteriota bacterium]